MRYYRLNRENKKALFWGDLGFKSLSIKDRNNHLFVNSNIYTWMYKDELSLVAYYLGDINRFKNLLQEILPLAPEEHRARLLKNKIYAE